MCVFLSIADLGIEVNTIQEFFTLSDVPLKDENIQNITNQVFGYAQKIICVQNNISGQNQSSSDISFTCKDTHISYGVFSLVLMYTPSCKIIGSILGPCTAGMFSKIWGFLLAILGSIMWMAGNVYELRITAAFFGTLGIYLILIGKIHEKSNHSNHRENILKSNEIYPCGLFHGIFPP